MICKWTNVRWVGHSRYKVTLYTCNHLLYPAGLPYELPSVTAAPVDADAGAPSTPAQQHAMVLAAGSFSAGRCAGKSDKHAFCRKTQLMQCEMQQCIVMQQRKAM